MPLLLTMSFFGSVGTLAYIVLQPLTKSIYPCGGEDVISYAIFWSI